METNNETVQAPEHYNPNQLVTYKVINQDVAEYPTKKVTDIEWSLHTGRQFLRDLTDLRNTVANLEEMLPGWIEEDESAKEIVSQICQLFNFNPTKEIEFEASVIVRGTFAVPLAEIADFDIDSLDLFVNVDSYGYDVNAEAEVENIIAL